MPRKPSDPGTKTERHRLAARRFRARNPLHAKAIARRSYLKRKDRPDVRAAKRKWEADNPDRVALARRRSLCRKHGITVEIYAQLLAVQNGRCAICERESNESGWSMCIDHDHNCCPGKTGCAKCIRGLLCAKCNQAIGCLQDNRSLLERAAAYIDKGTLVIA